MRAAYLFVAALPVLAFGPLGCAVPEPDESEIDGEEPTGDRDDQVGSGTVEQAMQSSCATASILPLSQQIIDEMRCMNPDGVAEVPPLANVEYSSGVFPYLVKPARDALVAAAKAKPGTTLHINSMLRNVAQQYMLRRWYEVGRCGITAAATPGNSNHETGLALDIQNSSTWRSALESRGFDWFGSSDVPHFDYVGSGAQNQKGLDVKAFQRLWNRNHPGDLISEDGSYGPQTKARIQKSPASGFAVGATCNDPEPPPDPEPDPNGWSCNDFPNAGEMSCAPDGNGRGQCVNGAVSFESCDNGCLIQSGSDACMGTTSSWSCSGSTGKTKMQNGNYVATAFGCSIKADGSAYNDPGDNCIPACLSYLKQNGHCTAGMDGPACERNITWFIADRDRFGCGAKVRVTANGKSVVLMAIDAGPACWVENNVDTGVLDMSYRAAQYLFGGPVGFDDGRSVHVVEVSAETPLGPVQ